MEEVVLLVGQYDDDDDGSTIDDVAEPVQHIAPVRETPSNSTVSILPFCTSFTQMVAAVGGTGLCCDSCEEETERINLYKDEKTDVEQGENVDEIRRDCSKMVSER